MYLKKDWYQERTHNSLRQINQLKNVQKKKKNLNTHFTNM